MVQASPHEIAQRPRVWPRYTHSNLGRGLNRLQEAIDQYSKILRDCPEITHFVAVKQDITERKQADEKLQREYQIRSVLNKLLGLSLKDLSLDALLDESIEQITSIPNLVFETRGAIFLMDRKTNTLVLKARRGLHPSLIERCATLSVGTCLCGRAAATKELVFENNLNEKHDVMFDGITDHGHYCVPILSSSKDVFGLFTVYVETGHNYQEDEALFLKGIADVLSGIIERKNAETEIQQQRNLLQSLIDSVPDLIFYKNPESVYLGANKAFGTLIERNNQDIQGLNDFDLFPEEVAEFFREQDRAMFEQLSSRQNEEWVDYPDGRRVLLDTLKTPMIDDEDKLLGMVGISRDITERKELELALESAKKQAEEATQAKGDFLANMSHEIRTPMNAVIGMAHLALKTELTPKQKDYLNKIQSSANSLLGIINDILDFSKIEAGKLDMESVEFNLDDVLDNLANLVTVKAQEKENLEILFATANEVPRFLVGDPLRLGQVLINLANNAVKFTDSGEIVVSTEVLKQNETGLSLKFSVRDTGIGLTEEQIGKLFQSFSQADTSTTRRGRDIQLYGQFWFGKGKS